MATDRKGLTLISCSRCSQLFADTRLRENSVLDFFELIVFNVSVAVQVKHPKRDLEVSSRY